MNREEALDRIVYNIAKWSSIPEGYGFDHWLFDGCDFIHKMHKTITIHDWNRAKIVPNTKVRILSLEHSRYIELLASQLDTKIEDPLNPHNFKWLSFYSDAKAQYGNGIVMDKEIFIELPETIEQKIDASNDYTSDCVLFKRHVLDFSTKLSLMNEKIIASSYGPKANDAIANARVLVEKVGAADVLTAGAKHLNDRAATYDSAEGERSMGATVDAFESITGHSLTEEQGWLFMVLLKAVRSQQGSYKLDNYEDGAAYFALMAESASEARK